MTLKQINDKKKKILAINLIIDMLAISFFTIGLRIHGEPEACRAQLEITA
jgi:hypothetical protein